MNLLALALTIIIFIIGLIGTVLPALPGPILIFGGILVYGFLTDFTKLNSEFFILQAIVLVIIVASDYVASAIGTRLSGGSRQAAIGATIGTIFALLFLGPLGIVIGPFVGACTVELLRGLKFAQAMNVGLGTLVGTLGGVLFKLCAEITMIIYFLMQIF
jgi:uncharacterized protein YqgC (DUF456 family)